MSRMSGQHVAPRCVGAACGDGCFDTVTMPIINILHQQFWAIGDFGLQNAYIQKNVHLMPVKRRRSVQNPTADRRRNFTRTYKLTHASVTYSLCQKGFLAVLGISETRLRTALKAVSVTGCPRQDQRVFFSKKREKRSYYGNTDDKFNVLHMGYKALVITFNSRPS